MEKATSEPPRPDYFIDYLKVKFDF
jgi:hypothetical protein